MLHFLDLCTLLFFKVLEGRNQSFGPQEVKKKKVNLLFSKTAVSPQNGHTSPEKPWSTALPAYQSFNISHKEP